MCKNNQKNPNLKFALNFYDYIRVRYHGYYLYFISDRILVNHENVFTLLTDVNKLC